MVTKTLTVALAVLFTLVPASSGAQQVYRCTGPDGSLTFSDLPCRSDSGRQERVDATPHQGHRTPARPGAPAYPPAEASTDAGGGRNADGSRNGRREKRSSRGLSRNERLALENARKSTLSELKRRHIGRERRRELIDELRRIDSRLGVEPEDVADMPFHDREVYEDHRVYPGMSRR
ncbi:MAG: DUF4124 domain-containing protein [Xanthomonadales bacterium]|nr:DUF4124 domain-containing protein [Xanthomonadales bacterium]